MSKLELFPCDLERYASFEIDEDRIGEPFDTNVAELCYLAALARGPSGDDEMRAEMFGRVLSYTLKLNGLESPPKRNIDALGDMMVGLVRDLREQSAANK